MENIGLVLEGGGMRGAFTGGVLHYLMEQNLYLPYTIGVSAGACNGSSYISHQPQRNYSVYVDFITHPEYISYKRFFKKRELFGMDFIFDTLPNELAPFDLKAFQQSNQKFVVGTTDCLTGNPVYFDKEHYSNDMYTILRASCSLPFLAPEIQFDGKYLFDGGISDPIPIKKSQQDGNKKNIVILTRNKGYLKKPESLTWLLKRKYGQYEGLIKTILTRHNVYNDTIRYLEAEEEKGNVLIIQPTLKMNVSRVEKKQKKLAALYQQGYEAAQSKYQELKNFI